MVNLVLIVFDNRKRTEGMEREEPMLKPHLLAVKVKLGVYNLFCHGEARNCL